MTTWRQKEIGAGEFKAKCLKLMDEVNRTGIELVITKRGIPVAKLVPAVQRKDSPFGWMEGTGRIVGDIVTSDPSEWEDEDDSHDPL
ncbi:MAG: type II toxin-antitoxin system Phd/YefM family antitoxin [Gemmatimonadota bacterium]